MKTNYTTDNDLERGIRLKKIRELLGKTQKELGVLLGGYTPSTVYGWEKMGYSISNKALAELTKLDVSLSYLLTGEGSPFLNEFLITNKKSTGENLVVKKISNKLKAGDIIRDYRKSLFFGHGGQQNFAEKLGVSRQLLSSWEVGRTVPSDENIKKLAKAFGIEAKQLKEEIDNALNGLEEETENTKKPTDEPTILDKKKIEGEKELGEFDYSIFSTNELARKAHILSSLHGSIIKLLPMLEKVLSLNALDRQKEILRKILHSALSLEEVIASCNEMLSKSQRKTLEDSESMRNVG